MKIKDEWLIGAAILGACLMGFISAYLPTRKAFHRIHRIEKCWILMTDGTNRLYRIQFDDYHAAIVTNPVIFEVYP